MEKIATVVESALNQELFSGASIRVERNGKVLVNQVYGNACHTEKSVSKLTFSHLFDLASLTKLFTTTAILHLISNKEFSLENTVSHFLPYPIDEFRQISLYSLLTHSSGLHYWYPFYTQKERAFEEILKLIIEEHPLKNTVIYSDINYMVLGKIIESVTDTSLDKALKELVWTPLGMNSTTYHPDKSRCVATEFGNQIEMKMVQDLSLSFSSFRPTDQPIVGESDDGNCYYYFNGVAGHAGIFSTAEDVARLGKAYLYPDHHYLSPELVKQAMTVQVENRGLGFQFGDNYPSGGCGHTGFTGTYLYLQKKKDLLITILTNRLHVKEVQQIQTFRNDVVNTILS